MIIIIMLSALAGMLIVFIFLLCKLIRTPKEETDIYEDEIHKLKARLKTEGQKFLTDEDNRILNEAELMAKSKQNEKSRGSRRKTIN